MDCQLELRASSPAAGSPEPPGIAGPGGAAHPAGAQQLHFSSSFFSQHLLLQDLTISTGSYGKIRTVRSAQDGRLYAIKLTEVSTRMGALDAGSMRLETVQVRHAAMHEAAAPVPCSRLVVSSGSASLSPAAGVQGGRGAAAVTPRARSLLVISDGCARALIARVQNEVRAYTRLEAGIENGAANAAGIAKCLHNMLRTDARPTI